MIPTGSRKIVVNVEEPLPKIGDSIWKGSKVVDFGHWSEIKKRWPEEAKKAIDQASVPEEKFGRTWVVRHAAGHHHLYGKADILFTHNTPTRNAIGFDGKHWPEGTPKEDEDEFRTPAKLFK